MYETFVENYFDSKFLDSNEMIPCEECSNEHYYNGSSGLCPDCHYDRVALGSDPSVLVEIDAAAERVLAGREIFGGLTQERFVSGFVAEFISLYMDRWGTIEDVTIPYIRKEDPVWQAEYYVDTKLRDQFFDPLVIGILFDAFFRRLKFSLIKYITLWQEILGNTVFSLSEGFIHAVTTAAKYPYWIATHDYWYEHISVILHWFISKDVSKWVEISGVLQIEALDTQVASAVSEVLDAYVNSGAVQNIVEFYEPYAAVVADVNRNTPERDDDLGGLVVDIVVSDQIADAIKQPYYVTSGQVRKYFFFRRHGCLLPFGFCVLVFTEGSPFSIYAPLAWKVMSGDESAARALVAYYRSHIYFDASVNVPSKQSARNYSIFFYGDDWNMASEPGAIDMFGTTCLVPFLSMHPDIIEQFANICYTSPYCLHYDRKDPLDGRVYSTSATDFVVMLRAYRAGKIDLKEFPALYPLVLTGVGFSVWYYPRGGVDDPGDSLKNESCAVSVLNTPVFRRFVRGLPFHFVCSRCLHVEDIW